MCIWDALNVNADRTKLFLMNTENVRICFAKCDIVLIKTQGLRDGACNVSVSKKTNLLNDCKLMQRAVAQHADD